MDGRRDAGGDHAAAHRAEAEHVHVHEAAGRDDPRPGGTGHAGRHRPAVHRHRRLAGAAARECR